MGCLEPAQGQARRMKRTHVSNCLPKDTNCYNESQEASQHQSVNTPFPVLAGQSDDYGEDNIRLWLFFTRLGLFLRGSILYHGLNQEQAWVVG